MKWLVLINDQLLLLRIENGLQEQGFGVGPSLLKLIAEFFIFLGQRPILSGKSGLDFQCAAPDHLL